MLDTQLAPQTPGEKQVHFFSGGGVLGYQAHFLALMRLSLQKGDKTDDISRHKCERHSTMAHPKPPSLIKL